MKKIGIFYGPLGGNTEHVAKVLQSIIGEDNADIVPIRDKKASDIDAYENVIFGMPTIGKDTWDAQKPDNGWDNFRPELEKIDYSNKTFALFGLGDAISYPYHFVDAIGNVGKKMMTFGAKIIGYVPVDEYEFKESNALTDDEKFFIGLPVDEDFEQDKTEERLKRWYDQLKKEFK